jgi:hypothetical protein
MAPGIDDTNWWLMPGHVTLHEPFATALTGAVAYLHDRYQSIGIVASGTIIRGTAHATSDLDIVAVHEQAWRQRTQRFFNDVPAEMFVNPVFQIRRQMTKDAEAGRPVMAHMLATGVIVHDPTGIAATLQAEARDNLDAGPTVSDEWLLLRRYGIATNLEDAVDLRDVDPDRARTLVVESLVEAVKWHFLNQGRWLPRSKALLADLDALDPDLGQAVRDALREPDLDRQLELAAPIVQRVVGHTGFFAWESTPQQLEP